MRHTFLLLLELLRCIKRLRLPLQVKSGKEFLQDYYLKHRGLSERDLDELVSKSSMSYEQVRDWFSRTSRRAQEGKELFSEEDVEAEEEQEEEQEEGAGEPADSQGDMELKEQREDRKQEQDQEEQQEEQQGEGQEEGQEEEQEAIQEECEALSQSQAEEQT